MTPSPQCPPMVPLRVAVLTISDTRTLADDHSGAYLAQALEEAGHELARRHIVVRNDQIHIVSDGRADRESDKAAPRQLVTEISKLLPESGTGLGVAVGSGEGLGTSDTGLVAVLVGATLWAVAGASMVVTGSSTDVAVAV